MESSMGQGIMTSREHGKGVLNLGSYCSEFESYLYNAI